MKKSQVIDSFKNCSTTSILCWDKPKKVRTTQEWKDHYGFDDGPTGGFMPNMSDDDKVKWKAKLVGTTTGYPQVEIRKTAGSQMTIIVNTGKGYNYKQYEAINSGNCYLGERKPSKPYKDMTVEEISKAYKINMKEAEKEKFPTKGINVHIALNGPAQMTFEELQEMQQAIEEAKKCLEMFEAHRTE